MRKLRKPVVTCAGVIILCGGILAAGILPAEGWDGPTPEADRVHGDTFTAVLPEHLAPLANSAAPVQPLALPPALTPAAATFPPSADFVAADVDGDGALELVMLSLAGEVVLWGP